MEEEEEDMEKERATSSLPVLRKPSRRQRAASRRPDFSRSPGSTLTSFHSPTFPSFLPFVPPSFPSLRVYALVFDAFQTAGMSTSDASDVSPTFLARAAAIYRKHVLVIALLFFVIVGLIWPAPGVLLGNVSSF
jgi:hypothetical protein